MNRKVFSTATSPPKANTVNNAGGAAFSRSAEECLAQLTLTGCFNNTYYTKGSDILTKLLEVAKQCDWRFVAQTTIYARQHGLMKDAPAVLLAYLTTVPEAHNCIYYIATQVINNGKMLRNFVQVIRSGVVGRRSLGTVPTRIVCNYLADRTTSQLLADIVGSTPSLSDIIKLAHPKPTEEQTAAFQYILGVNYDDLPTDFRHWEQWKLGSIIAPKAPFELLTGIKISDEQWAALAKQMTWTQLVKNLNTLQRHGIFSVVGEIDRIAAKIADRQEILRSRSFPYQIMSAYLNATDVPRQIVDSLHDAMEIAAENVPGLPGNTLVAVDVSGSMAGPITGNKKGATSKVRCIDVAALIAACIARKNPNATIVAFDTRLHSGRIETRDSIMTIARRLASYGGGGTNCSLPLQQINSGNTRYDNIIYISDNESWADGHYSINTGMSAQWQTYKRRYPNAKLICIDLTPNSTTQVSSRSDCLNIGGFNDSYWNMVEEFLTNKSVSLIGEIKRVPLGT